MRHEWRSHSTLMAVVLGVLFCLGTGTSFAIGDDGVVIEAVVASVDGNPITLAEVQQRVGRVLSLKEMVSDAEARAAVDALILEHLIMAEAEQRKISVSDTEVNEYMGEVAKRNGLTQEGLLEALKGQNMTLERYRDQVKLDILKARIGSAALRGGVAISDEQVDQYIMSHPRQFQGGNTVELRQILLLTSKHSAADARRMLESIKKRVQDDEEDFEELAKEVSEGPEAAEGGDLGEIRESDLNPVIFDAVLSLKEGEISDVVQTDAGYHLFYVEDRNQREVEVSEAQRQEIRKLLEGQALEVKSSGLFNEELAKHHSVERKF